MILLIYLASYLPINNIVFQAFALLRWCVETKKFLLIPKYNKVLEDYNFIGYN